MLEKIYTTELVYLNSHLLHWWLDISHVLNETIHTLCLSLPVSRLILFALGWKNWCFVTGRMCWLSNRWFLLHRHDSRFEMLLCFCAFWPFKLLEIDRIILFPHQDLQVGRKLLSPKCLSNNFFPFSSPYVVMKLNFFFMLWKALMSATMLQL